VCWRLRSSSRDAVGLLHERDGELVRERRLGDRNEVSGADSASGAVSQGEGAASLARRVYVRSREPVGSLDLDDLHPVMLPAGTRPADSVWRVHARHDIGIAAHIGAYSDAVEVEPGFRWLVISGTPGMTADAVVPEDFEAQATLAWSNVVAALDKAGFGVHDLVKITQYLTSADDIPAHAAIRSQFLGTARPASMLLVVSALPWPQMSIEVEAWAARAP
jgi:2-iminobutanoate/2-iminopropanoate deaminase